MSSTKNDLAQDCAWPTIINGSQVKSCAFAWDEATIRRVQLRNGREVVLGELPAGTRLFHATLIRYGDTPWFTVGHPRDDQNGMVWFASTLEHLRMIEQATHHLAYELARPLTLVFQKHIPGKDRGYEFVKSFMTTGKQLYQQQKIAVDGYASCSECEVALLNESIVTAFRRTARVKELVRSLPGPRSKQEKDV